RGPRREPGDEQQHKDERHDHPLLQQGGTERGREDRAGRAQVGVHARHAATVTVAGTRAQASRTNVKIMSCSYNGGGSAGQARSSVSCRRPRRPQMAALNTVITNSRNVTMCTPVQYSQMLPIVSSASIRYTTKPMPTITDARRSRCTGRHRSRQAHGEKSGTAAT